MRQRLTAFRCPSDNETGSGKQFDLPDGSETVTGAAPNGAYGHTNYVANIGTYPRVQPQTSSGNINRFNGIMSEVSSVRIRDITDGTSNTLALAECVIGFPHLQVNASVTPEACPQNGSSSTNSSRQRGNSWFYGELPASVSFTAAVGPNSRLYDCGSNTDRAMFAARSMHTGGVQIALGDGAVKFASENIDLTIWQNLGARNDGNVVGEW